MSRNHRTSQKVKPVKLPKHGAGLAKAASMRKAGPMKHRLVPRGGASNEAQGYLDEYSNETDYAIEDSCVECDNPGAELRFGDDWREEVDGDSVSEGRPTGGQSGQSERRMLCDACYKREVEHGPLWAEKPSGEPVRFLLDDTGLSLV